MVTGTQPQTMWAPWTSALPQLPPQACWISPKLPHLRPTWSPPDHAPKACQAGDPQTFTISTGPCPSGLQGLQSTTTHNLHQDCNPQTCQAGDSQALTISTPLGPCPSGIPGPNSKGLLDCLKDRPLPAGLWNTTHVPPTIGGLQTCLGDTDRSRC
jgi:hypothetical protein